jgi:hypothetical protein
MKYKRHTAQPTPHVLLEFPESFGIPGIPPDHPSSSDSLYPWTCWISGLREAPGFLDSSDHLKTIDTPSPYNYPTTNINMTALQFIEALKTVPLTKEEYATLDFTGSACDEFIANHTIHPKDDPQGFPPIDELIVLVSEYDLTKVPIGLLWFDEFISLDDDFFQVGTLGATALCICRYTGEVLIIPDYDVDDDPDGIVFDYDTPTNPRHRCAITGDCFLAALLYAAVFFEKNCIHPHVFDNTAVIETVAEHCADMAGGGEYVVFWVAFLRSEFL